MVVPTDAPMYARSLPMVTMSRTMAMLCSVTGSAVSSAAAITGSAEFFAPLMATVPCSALPPLMTNLSMGRLFSQRLPKISLRRKQPGSC